MASRFEHRRAIRLKVNLRGVDRGSRPFEQSVFTHDISLGGARLLHVPPFFEHSSRVEINYRGKKVKFRVVWIAEGTNEIGIENLEPAKRIWGSLVAGRPQATSVSVSPATTGANDRVTAQAGAPAASQGTVAKLFGWSRRFAMR